MWYLTKLTSVKFICNYPKFNINEGILYSYSYRINLYRIQHAKEEKKHDDVTFLEHNKNT